jgi:hypothetical protein
VLVIRIAGKVGELDGKEDEFAKKIAEGQNIEVKGMEHGGIAKSVSQARDIHESG